MMHCEGPQSFLQVCNVQKGLCCSPPAAGSNVLVNLYASYIADPPVTLLTRLVYRCGRWR